MKEEMKACFDTLLTEYPSGMFVNSLLAGKYFNIKQDYVVVGNGAAELIKSIMKEMKGKIGIVYPTFEEYPNRLNKDAIVPFNATRKDYNYTAEDLKPTSETRKSSTYWLSTQTTLQAISLRPKRLSNWYNGARTKTYILSLTNRSSISVKISKITAYCTTRFSKHTPTLRSSRAYRNRTEYLDCALAY